MDKHKQIRRCIATGVSLPKETLLRFVIGPEGRVIPDVACTLPGRGVWVRCRRDLVEQAVRRKMFTRHAKQPVSVNAELPEQVETLLRRRCLEWLGMARKSGVLVAGYEKTREALKAKEAALLLEAEDGAEEGKKKLRVMAGEIPIVGVFNSTELSSIYGGTAHIVHAALTRSALAERVRENINRLLAYQEGSHAESESGKI